MLPCICSTSVVTEMKKQGSVLLHNVRLVRSAHGLGIHFNVFFPQMTVMFKDRDAQYICL